MALFIVSLEVETWALAVASCLLIFRYGAEQDWWPAPSSWLVNILAVVGLGIVYAQFKTFLGEEASSTLLVIIASLRIADLRSQRDERLLILLSFLLVSIKFLFTLDLVWVPVGASICLLLWRSLLPDKMENPWRETILVCLRSLPVVLVLFFIFPRVQIPWAPSFRPALPISGMTESLSPGDIAELSMNQETAFRAEFLSFKPHMRELYWRGAVLEEGQGFKWSKSTKNITQIEVGQQEMASDYIVVLEPLNLKVLPVLEHTRFLYSPTVRAFKTDRGTFKTEELANSRIKYLAQSTVNWAGPTTPQPTKLEEDLPPQTARWVSDTLNLKPSYFLKLQALKRLFRENSFAYSQKPGTYRNLDEFLFDRRIGFCEHFAGAYATLARALGIPARIVTGYQGGEWNEAGNFLRVSQADAHAWVEVRDPKGQWQRVDPTFWIAPLRIELGGLAYFKLSPAEQNLSSQDVLERMNNLPMINKFLMTLENQMESLNYRWTTAILSFDLSEQQKLIQFFAPQVGWWVASLMLALLLFRVLQNFIFQQRQSQDQAAAAFHWIEALLSRKGFLRAPNEGPVRFLTSVGKMRPQDQALIEKTIQLYRFERYRERKVGPDDWSRLKRGWKKAFSKDAIKFAPRMSGGQRHEAGASPASSHKSQ
jgi:transglutaminase-like putative cysteine protease